MATRPLSTTVTRYQRLHLSRRRGNAIRQHLGDAGIIEAVPIATRSGQVVLYQLADHGRSVCKSIGIDTGPTPRTSVEHSFWMRKAAEHFEKKGYDVTREYAFAGNGVIDLLAERPGERLSIEIETGKSDALDNIKRNLEEDGFDNVYSLGTNQAVVTKIGEQIKKSDVGNSDRVRICSVREFQDHN